MEARTHHRLWSLLALAGGLLLTLALAGNTGGTCTPLDPVPYCEADEDCGGVPPVDCVGDWVCDAGTCEFVCDDPTLPPEACTSDADCAADEVCVIERTDDCCPPDAPCFFYLPVCEGTCQPVAPPPVECRTDADCGPGHVCVEEWDECPPPPGCEPGDLCPAVCGEPVLVGAHCEPLPPSECVTDADCAEGEFCAIPPGCGWNCPDDEMCPGWDMVCVDTCQPVQPPPVECWSDADCGPGMMCRIDDWCMDDCPEGADCAADPMWCGGVCVPVEPPPTECWSDADCGPGMICQIDEWCAYECGEDGDCGASPDRMWCGGVCVPVEPPPVECRDDADCGPGMRCVFPTNCGPTPDCPDGADCDPALWNCGGVCEPVEPPPSECWSDADCGPGMRCEWSWDDAECCPPNALCSPDIPPCGGRCVPVEPPPVECWSNADCPDGTACEFLYDCAQPYCPEGEECDEPVWGCPGVCVPVEPNPDYPYCDEDADCHAGERCEPIDVAYAGDGGAAERPCRDMDGDGRCDEPWMWGICVPVEPPPAECLSDGDCPAGMHCEPLYYPMDGEPSSDFAPCFDEDGDGQCDDPYVGGVCVPNDPPPQGDCQADWDCAADQRCQIDWAVCEEGCGPNMDCVPCVGRCVPIKECLSDADCPGGTVCDFGEWGCPAWDCDHDNGSDCVPPPCTGICREPVFGARA